MNLIREALRSRHYRPCLFSSCEKECARKEVDEAVTLMPSSVMLPITGFRKKQNRLFGSMLRRFGCRLGPCRLAALMNLVKMGYPVTVFEAQPLLGEC